MKVKTIFILLVFIMFLVGISCVSAENMDEISSLSSSDVADDVISLDDEVADGTIGSVESDVSTSSVNDEVISEEEQTSNDYSWGDFQSEVENTSNYRVELRGNIAPSSNSNDQIKLNHSVEIIGSPDYYIGSADWSSAATYNYIPFVTAQDGLYVKFENVTFQYLSNNILIKLMGNGSFVFKNCVFDHINATGDHQSVIWLNHGYALIENCTFTNCRCSFGAVTNYYSSIESTVNNARMAVRNSTFRNNYATTEPGAINNCGFLEVYDSVFENNEATWWAGAIHTHMYANTQIYHSNFTNNTAGWNGGALYTYSYLRVINSTFIANEAHQTSGGAIAASSYGSSPYVTVENCKFYDNTASGSGGAISHDSGQLDVKDSIFANNIASTGRGGAIYATGQGILRVDNSKFINDTGSQGQDIAYYYTNTENYAYLYYDYNEFWGRDNASGSIYAFDDHVIVHRGDHNIFHDISEFDPGDENSTNDTNDSDSVVPIPDGTPIGNQEWNVSLNGTLGGTPLVYGDRIYVSNGHFIYCLDTNGNVIWNKSSEWGYFHELVVYNNVLFAPCSWDKLYMYDPFTGNEIQPTSNMYQASSYYAPAINGDTLYISSEYPYGDNNNAWIAVVKYINNNYTYVGSILEINNVSYGTQALLSAPILWNNNLYVNTIEGLMRINLASNASSVILANTVGKPVLGGNVLYVLTSDNHICGIDGRDYVVENITVPGNVGSTLAINNGNNVLYTIDANGTVYRVETSHAVDGLIQVNPVSSALAVGYDGNLYVGDDAGIFWVIKPCYDFIYRYWYGDIVWAYNASSAIYGTPVIYNGVVYIGTNDTFYALSNPSINLFSLKSNNMLLSSVNNQLIYNNDLLGTNVNDVLENVPNEKYLNEKELSITDFSEGDTIYYLNEGIYSVYSQAFAIGGEYNYEGTNVIGIKEYKENIIIKPNGTANVTIKFKPQGTQVQKQKTLMIMCANNITFENIKFIVESPYSSNKVAFIKIETSQNITFKNCTFENMQSSSSSPSLISIERGSILATENINIIDCIFSKCNVEGSIISINENQKDFTIAGCTFSECSVGVGKNILSIDSGNIHLENNTFDSIAPITITGGKIVSPTFKVLTKSLKVGEEGNIEAELIDDNGNRIKSSKLKFSIGRTTTEDYISPNSEGLYIYPYTPSEVGELSVGVVCDDIEYPEADNEPIIVKGTTDLSINCSDSTVYGSEFVVNATLDSSIYDENITFAVFNSTNDPIKSVNATINGGFANYSFTGLPVGEYSVTAYYGGGTYFDPVSKDKSFTITQADSSIEIHVLNDVIHVGEAIQVTGIVPSDATGNMSFRITDGKTVNVGETATFDGLTVAGEYTVYAIYNGDKNYKASKEVNTTIKVIKYNLDLDISADNIDYGDDLVVKVNTNTNFTGDVLVKVGDKNQTAHITKGAGNATFVNLTAGEYNITAIFTENKIFNADAKNTTATVRDVVPAAQALNTNVPDNSKSPTFSIKLDKDATGNFTVSIDGGKTFNKTVELINGSASITAENLSVGDHVVILSYSGDGKYAAIIQNTTVSIKEPAKTNPGKDTKQETKKTATKIVAKKKTFKAKKKVKKYTITLKAGKKPVKNVQVTLKIKGKTYKAKTNAKGKAVFKIKNLKKKGKYTAVIKFKGNSNYNAATKKVKITVKK